MSSENGSGRAFQILGLVLTMLGLGVVLIVALMDRDSAALTRHEEYAERTFQKKEVASEVYRQLRRDLQEVKADIKLLLRRTKR